MENTNSSYITSLLQDITEQKKAREQLEAAKVKFTNIDNRLQKKLRRFNGNDVNHHEVKGWARTAQTMYLMGQLTTE